MPDPSTSPVPTRKIAVGVLGATGAVGQTFVRLLAGHPWFRTAEVAASEQSAGKAYGEATDWRQPVPMPADVAALEVGSCEPGGGCQIYFSALDAAVAGAVEERFAAAGAVVLSNARNHRMEPDVPLLIPEVNPEHLGLLDRQRRRRGWSGAVVTNPNCSTVGLALALAPLHRRFGARQVFVATLQAVSGAGYPGPASIDVLGNVIPRIAGEEDKIETEPCKILGRFEGGGVVPAPIGISAHANRVAVRDGHTECVSVALERPVEPEEAAALLEGFSGRPQELGLPSAPARPIRLADGPDRPQPRLDLDAGHGMTVTIGRLRPCPLLDLRFTLLVHNTVRGAAGGALLNAELMVAEGLVEGVRAPAVATARQSSEG